MTNTTDDSFTSVQQELDVSQRTDYTPEEALVYAIIQSGVEDMDYEYLNGKLCELHCQLVGFDVDIIRENV